MLKKTSTTAALGTLVASSIGLVTASPAFAVADYTVTNCNSEGTGSLYAGVGQLNAASGGTIDFSNSLNCTTISLPSFLEIAKDITIVGPASSTITIKNQSNGRFFYATGAGDLSVSNLTFDGEESYQLLSMWDSGATGFSASFDNVQANNFNNDYAIAMNAGSLSISDSTFTDDNSQRAASFIYATNVTVTGSEFIGNGYGEGSLLSGQNSLTVTDSKFDNNDVTVMFGSLFDSQNATLNNVVVSNSNVSSLTTTGNMLQIVGSSITNNVTDGPLFAGNQGNIEISNSTIAENVYGVGQAVFTAFSTTAYFNTFLNNEESDQQIGQIVSGVSVTLGGNIFASDENYAFRCSTTGSAIDLGGNLFTSQPVDCALPSLPTTAADGVSAVVPFADLHISQGTTLASGEEFWVLGAGSVALNYINALSDNDFNVTVDQIGSTRPLDGKRDAGSIEMPSTQRACTPLAKSTVNFAPYSSKLTNGAKNKLRAYASALNASGCTSIKINGYTATTSKAASAGAGYRLALANKRTMAVLRYLRVQFARLGMEVTTTRSAYGARSPKKSNENASGRAANRRVEIVVVPPSS